MGKFGKALVALAATMMFWSASATAATIDFTAMDNAIVPTISQDGVTIYGHNGGSSADLSILKFNGLGVSGGSTPGLESYISGPEAVTFVFDAPVKNVTYTSRYPISTGITGVSARDILAYDNGVLVNRFTDTGEALDKDISAVFGGELFDMLIFAGVDESYFHINEISFELVNVSAVPLPAAIPLFAAGMGILGLMGWRRKRVA